MRRRSAKARMGLRGRSGVLAYMLFGTAVLVSLYYIWNNYFFTASSKITYSSVQGLRPGHLAQWDKQKQQGIALEEPPIGLNREIEIQVHKCLVALGLFSLRTVRQTLCRLMHMLTQSISIVFFFFFLCKSIVSA